MDILFLFILIGVAVFGFNRLLRWAHNQDRKERGKGMVDELERWLRDR